MANAFDINPPETTISIQAGASASLAFPTTNRLGTRVDAHLEVVATSEVMRWVTMEGDQVRPLKVGETDLVVIKLEVPADAKPDAYSLELRVSNISNPTEQFSTSPKVTMAVSAGAPVPPPQKPSNSMWILLVVGMLAVVGGGFAIFKGCGGEEEARVEVPPEPTPEPETCNGEDDDLDRQVDEGLDNLGPCESDAQGDCRPGVLVCSDGEQRCKAEVEPGEEKCGGGDEDCDGKVDEGLGNLGPCEGNGQGDCKVGVLMCIQGAQTCKPTKAKPGKEKCGGGDEDCDGKVDEGGAEGCTHYGRDADSDRHYVDVVCACAAPPGLKALPANAPSTPDCDDRNRGRHPGATETVGDGVDQNCDGKEQCYVDWDGDGYRGKETTLSNDTDCIDGYEAMKTLKVGDCCDRDANVHPGSNVWRSRASACGTFDFNCDGRQEQRWGPANSQYKCNKFERCQADDVGWTGSPTPKCGQSGSWANGCIGNAFSCWWRNHHERLQECR